jgi:hypothetical protein
VHEEPRELSPRRQRLRRYTKITAASGLLVAAASLIIAMNLPMSGLLNGVLVGLSITIASALARTFEGGLILRRTLGAVMITIPIIPMFFGGPPFLPLMSAPGLIIAVYLLTSRRSRLRSSVIVLAGAIIYAALWLYGLFPGTLIDGSWVVVVYQMWSPKFFYQAGLERLTTLWALQLEKTMALTAGTYLLLTALFSKVRAPTRWTALAVVTVSLLPLLLLAPPPARGIEGGAMLKVTVLTVDDVPVSKLEVDVGREPGPPPEGGLETSDDNGTATFYIRPGSYVVYFNAANYPTDLIYPNKVYQIDVSEVKPNKLTISLNYSSPGIAAPSGYSVWLTRAYDPNATHLAAISSGEQVHLWVQGPKGDSSEFSVYIPIAGEMVRANTSHLDPTGKPINLGFGISVGSPSDVTIEIRIQRKTVASVTVNVS